MAATHHLALLAVLVLEQSLFGVSVPPSCYGVVSPDVEACKSPGHLYHLPEHWSGRRSLKQQDGWWRQVEILPPAFVTWEREDESAMALHGFRIDALFGCSDRNDWSLPWPPPLDVYFLCEDYAPGGVNDMFCDVDEGWAFASETWMLARTACARACQSCCYNSCQGQPGCTRTCDRPFETSVFNGTHNETVTIDDPFLNFLNYRGTYRRYVQLLEQAQDRTAVFYPAEFQGGLFQEVVNVSMLTLNNDVVVHYTTDRSTPTFQNGELGTHVSIDRNTHLQAIAFEPGRETQYGSSVAAVDIQVKPLPPAVSVLSCETEDGAVAFNETAPYSDQLCISAVVRVMAVNRRADETFLRYALGGQSARPSNPQGIAEVTFVVAVPGVVSAVAWVPDMVPSDVTQSPFIHIPALVAVSRGWMATVGLWNLVPDQFTGSYQRARSGAGGCGEVHGTAVEPAMVADATELLGPAVLKGPDCKGGVWDLGGGLSPTLLSFAQTADDGAVPGLRFDSLNRGLYVSEDVSGLAGELLPRERLTVEATFSVGAPGGVALAGLVGCRLDAAASGGFRYGKGWSLGYSTDAGAGTLTVLFSLALARNEVRAGLGGIRDFTATVPAATATGRLAHVAAVYDGRWARIFINGVLVTEAAACGAGEECGSILYPLATDDLYTQGRTAPLTLGVLDSTDTGALASHVGVLRMVRVMAGALSGEQVAAGAQRRVLDGASRLCPLGRYGPYEGLEPCFQCEAGTVSPERGLETCEPCAQGFFTEGRGATDCLLCPPGMTTPAAGSAECTADDCLLGTHTCHPEATCEDTGVGERSFTCTCNAGFAGDGEACLPECGDGVVAGGEGCDDGNTLAGDGCSRDCEVEADFECRPGLGGASECTCTALPEECCTKSHAYCRQLVEEGAAEQLACLSEYGECLQSASARAIPSPDIQQGPEPDAATAGAGDCHALFSACGADETKSGSDCLRLYGGCLKALVYE